MNAYLSPSNLQPIVSGERTSQMCLSSERAPTAGIISGKIAGVLFRMSLVSRATPNKPRVTPRIFTILHTLWTLA